MHPSYYRRPLFVALVLLGAWIYFFRRDVRPPPGDVSLLCPLKNAVIEAGPSEFQRLRGGKPTAVVRVKSVNGLPAHGGLLVKLPDGASVRWRAATRFRGDMEAPRGAAVPGGLDWPLYLRRQGVFAEFDAVSAEEISPPPFIARAAFAARRQLGEFLKSRFEPEAAAVLAALALGDKDGMTDEIAAPFRDSGTIHLLVASGTHVAFVLAIVYFLCRLLSIRRGYQEAAVAAAAGFYVIAAGMNPPLLRSYAMALSAMAGYRLQRESGAFAGLVLAAFCVLLTDGQSLFKPDFQMSFLAVFAIITVFSNMELPRGRLRWLVECAVMTAAAQLALFPVCVEVFHRYSLAAFIANIPLVPLAGALMVLIFACVVFAALKLAPLTYAAVKLTAFAVWLFARLAEVFASYSWSAVWVPSPGAGVMSAYCCLAFWILHLPSPQRAKKLFLPLLAAGICAVAAQYVFAPPQRMWEYHSGKTSGAMLRAKGLGLVMADCGFKGDALFRAVLESGGREIDVLLLSSLSESSWRGLAGLGRNAAIGAVYLPHGPLAPELEKELLRLQTAGTQIRRLWPGDEVVAAGWRISAVRGIHHSRKGLWREAGYSGNPEQDSLSFIAERGGFAFLYSRRGWS
ncbi:MAG: ComEC/Rec2 family competence protein [Elusimicrobiales bacterium]